MATALLIRVAFTRDAYSGGDLGRAEELPSPARIHAAFASAAGGGPWANVEGHVLTADSAHAAAVRWLEDSEPLGLMPPVTQTTGYSAHRYRLRTAPDHPNDTEFEPFSALDGPVTYAWPAPDTPVLEALRQLAPEVTHIGRSESTAIVDVSLGEVDNDAPRFLANVPGRGPGQPLRIPTPGRFDALVEAHTRALKPGPHTTGRRGRQAADIPAETAGEIATRLRRFARVATDGTWPFAEAWRVQLDGSVPRWATRIDRRVAFATAIHRGLVAAIGTDVPSFVTGRDGESPRTGAGHLAIHPIGLRSDRTPTVVLGLPADAPEADRAMLLDALSRRPRMRLGNRTLRLGEPQICPALPFWQTRADVMSTEVPLVLDAPGTPRRGRWTLDDAVLCSVGYALRGVLERDGLEWGTGWSFRRALVAALRERGVNARASRVAGSASPYLHRAREGDLLVAVQATIGLGDLAAGGGGLLAIGRARHLGGGLLRPSRQETA